MQQGPRQTIIFLHLPKTAGTTLSSLLVSNLQPSIFIETADDVREFFGLSQQQREMLRLAYGHMPYGLHRYIEQPCKYCVFLRDPIDRIISAYYYLMSERKHPLYDVIADGMTLGEFAELGENDNGQTRRLGGYCFTEILEVRRWSVYWWGTIPPEAINNIHLEQAKRTLDVCEFVGFTESFQEDVHELFHMLDLPTPTIIPVANRTDDRPKTDDIDADTLEKIRSRNLLDMQLYEYALKVRERYHTRALERQDG